MLTGKDLPYFENYINGLGYRLREHQVKPTERFFKTDKDFFILQAPRQTIKSWLCARIASYLMFCKGGDVIVIAPKMKQATKIIGYRIRQDIKKIFPKNIRYKYVPTMNNSEVRLINGGSMRCFSGKTGADIEGEGCNLLILDEAQKLDYEHIASNAHPFLAGGQLEDGTIASKAIAIGRGGTPSSYIEKMKETDYAENYFLDVGEVVEHYPPYEKKRKMFKDTMSEAEYKAHVLCKPLLTDQTPLLREYPTYTSLPKGDPYKGQIGIDWGISMDDTACISLQAWRVNDNSPMPYQFYVVNAKKSPYQEVEKQIDKTVVPFIRHPENIYYEAGDIIAEGNGLGEAFQSILRTKVDDARIKFVNNEWKSKKGKLLRWMVENEKLLFPENDEHLKQELLDIECTYTEVNNTLKLGHSDFLSALLLTLDKVTLRRGERSQRMELLT